ncbi:hypothetical protein [Paraburkholderia bannensis]|uniref:hypothetical protein n=1 Tax=Paraburkholderia bannensis TaxID=765414 RepID=UPI002AB6D8D8|nr:hypothetical protein [Paraburkholderia bannensis]
MQPVSKDIALQTFSTTESTNHESPVKDTSNRSRSNVSTKSAPVDASLSGLASHAASRAPSRTSSSAPSSQSARRATLPTPAVSAQRAGTNSSTAIQSPANVTDSEPANATPRRDMGELQATLDKQKTREIDRHALASVLQEVRFNPVRADLNGALPSNGQLVSQITDDQLGRWYEALSVSREDVAGMESAAYSAGLKIPTSSSVFNVVSYGAIPMLFAALSGPNLSWAQAGASAMLAFAQPVVTAPIQSLVIGAIDYYRRLGQPEIKLDKKAVNSSKTQAAIKEKIEQSVVHAKESEAAVVELLQKHSWTNADGDVALDDIDPAKLSKSERMALVAACEKHMTNIVELCNNAGQMHALDGAHARQVESTLKQIFPRAVRSGSGMVAPFIRKPGAHAPHSALSKVIPFKAPPLGVAGVSVFIAMAALVWQHFAAARDEVNGLKLEHKLNMLHANFFEEGKENVLHSDGKITADDISVEKCRKMVMSPEANTVLRVADRLDATIRELEAQKEARATREPTPAEAEAGHARHDPDLEQKLDAYKRDAKNLRSLNVTDELHEDTQSLLNDALNGSFGFAWNEGVAKLKKPLEFSAQVSQRLGQTFTMGPLGSAGALLGGRVVTAALKGNDHISTLAQFGLAFMSLAIGLIAASTQGAVTNVKNRRRDTDPPEQAMGFKEQTFSGMAAPLEAVKNWRQSQQALRDAATPFTELQGLAQKLAPMLERLVAPPAGNPAETGGRVSPSEQAAAGPSRTAFIEEIPHDVTPRQA